MDDNKKFKLFKKKEKYYYYDQDKEDIEEHGSFKVYLIALGVIMIVGTIWNYNYLGGLEGIMTQKMLLIEGYTSYFAAVGSLVLMPVLAVIFLWLAFRKPKKHAIDSDDTDSEE